MKAGLPLGSRTAPHKGGSSSFSRAANVTSTWTGKPAAFLLALGTVIVWGVSGPIFQFSDTWQLVINTGTTIITFLMVFLIQNTQNRDTLALQLKLDELLFATKAAHNDLAGIEEAPEEQLEELKEEVRERAKNSH